MGYDFSLDCVHNGYKNLLGYRNKGKEPRLIFVYDPPHAYLVVAGKVLNKGVTAYDNFYPDYTSREINEMLASGRAEDITSSLDVAYESGGEIMYSVNGQGYPLEYSLLKR